jgi:hypothetical protein
MNNQEEERKDQAEKPEEAVKPEGVEKAEESKPEEGTIEGKIGEVLTSFIKEFDKVEKPAEDRGHAEKL